MFYAMVLVFITHTGMPVKMDQTLFRSQAKCQDAMTKIIASSNSYPNPMQVKVAVCQPHE